MPSIAETAIISSEAVLAPDVTVGPFSIIGPQVTIGAGTVIGPYVRIEGPTTIGERNRIIGQASIGTEPQDLKFKGEKTELRITYGYEYENADDRFDDGPAVFGHVAQDPGELLRQHGSKVWLVNTGWTGGSYGVGHRIKIAYTRAMINAALSGALDNVGYERDPIFNLDVPTSCPHVPVEVLTPRNTWADKAAYDAAAGKIAGMFHDNFAKYAEGVSEAVRNAGPVASDVDNSVEG